MNSNDSNSSRFENTLIYISVALLLVACVIIMTIPVGTVLLALTSALLSWLSRSASEVGSINRKASTAIFMASIIVLLSVIISYYYLVIAGYKGGIKLD